jgi:hypothetical protein
VTKVQASNEGLSYSSIQTDIMPKISKFCARNTPFHIIILVCLSDSCSRLQTSIVRATLCTSVQKGANHFCEPSDRPVTTKTVTTTCFSKLIAYIVWCSCCCQTSFNLPPTVVLRQALSVRRALSPCPKTACPKMPRSIIMTTNINNRRNNNNCH